MYLFRDLDKQEKNGDDKHVVKDTDNSDDDVDDHEHFVTYVGQIWLHFLRFKQGCCDVVPFSGHQRRVLHGCCQLRGLLELFIPAAGAMAAEF